jgi:hypothetical protein
MFPLYPEELLSNIIVHVPLERSQVLLYKNGEMNPALVKMEVDLHQRNALAPALYIGFVYPDGTGVVETHLTSKALQLVEKLQDQASKGEAMEYVVVNGLKME